MWCVISRECIILHIIIPERDSECLSCVIFDGNLGYVGKILLFGIARFK